MQFLQKVPMPPGPASAERAALTIGAVHSVNPFVAVEVIRGNRLYCVDECRADEYELFVLRRAGDLAPFERERIKMVLGISPWSGKSKEAPMVAGKNCRHPIFTMLSQPIFVLKISK
jgi:hypothetical protein